MFSRGGVRTVFRFYWQQPSLEQWLLWCLITFFITLGEQGVLYQTAIFTSL